MPGVRLPAPPACCQPHGGFFAAGFGPNPVLRWNRGLVGASGEAVDPWNLREPETWGLKSGGSVQGQVGRGLEQPGPVEGVPAHGRGVETR